MQRRTHSTEEWTSGKKAATQARSSAGKGWVTLQNLCKSPAKVQTSARKTLSVFLFIHCDSGDPLQQCGRRKKKVQHLHGKHTYCSEFGKTNNTTCSFFVKAFYNVEKIAPVRYREEMSSSKTAPRWHQHPSRKQSFGTTDAGKNLDIRARRELSSTS